MSLPTYFSKLRTAVVDPDFGISRRYVPFYKKSAFVPDSAYQYRYGYPEYKETGLTTEKGIQLGEVKKKQEPIGINNLPKAKIEKLYRYFEHLRQIKEKGIDNDRIQSFIKKMAQNKIFTKWTENPEGYFAFSTFIALDLEFGFFEPISKDFESGKKLVDDWLYYLASIEYKTRQKANYISNFVLNYFAGKWESVPELLKLHDETQKILASIDKPAKILEAVYWVLHYNIKFSYKSIKDTKFKRTIELFPHKYIISFADEISKANNSALGLSVIAFGLTALPEKALTIWTVLQRIWGTTPKWFRLGTIFSLFALGFLWLMLTESEEEKILKAKIKALNEGRKIIELLPPEQQPKAWEDLQGLLKVEKDVNKLTKAFLNIMKPFFFIGAIYLGIKYIVPEVMETFKKKDKAK